MGHPSAGHIVLDNPVTFPICIVLAYHFQLLQTLLPVPPPVLRLTLKDEVEVKLSRLFHSCSRMFYCECSIAPRG